MTIHGAFHLASERLSSDHAFRERLGHNAKQELTSPVELRKKRSIPSRRLKSAKEEGTMTNQQRDLTGLRALVTGATSGLGRAIAIQLARDGADVIVHGRDAMRGAQTVDEIHAQGGSARYVGADLSDAASITGFAKEVGDIDILVNNAGFSMWGPTESFALASFDALFAANVRAPFFLVGAFAPGMVARKTGSIINISSMAGHLGLTGGAAYGLRCLSGGRVLAFVSALTDLDTLGASCQRAIEREHDDMCHDGHHVTPFMTNIMYHVNWYPNRGQAVRVTREQAAANREKVLDVAGTLFRERGFDGIGVADIMKRAGLTHGGFYGQFASKADLAAETTARVLGNPGWQERLTGKANPSFNEVVHGYLSPRHRDDPGTGCLFAALGSDAARQPRAVRRALTDGFRVRLDAWLKLVTGRSATARREKALVTMATLVGALIIARAIDDSALSDEVLKATATELGRR